MIALCLRVRTLLLSASLCARYTSQHGAEADYRQPLNKFCAKFDPAQTTSKARRLLFQAPYSLIYTKLS